MCTRYIVMFDCHLYWCVHVTSSCTWQRNMYISRQMEVEQPDITCTHQYGWESNITMQRVRCHVRLPLFLMCTCYIVMFASHPLDVYKLYRHLRLPSVLMCTCYIVNTNTDGSRIWRCNVYTLIRMGVEYDDVRCTHQDRWESHMMM
jgi:hypothetical protein